MKYSIFFVLLICIFAVSCGDDSNPVNSRNPHKLAALYPFLNLGNRFVYQIIQPEGNTRMDTIRIQQIESADTLGLYSDFIFCTKNRYDTLVFGSVYSDSSFIYYGDYSGTLLEQNGQKYNAHFTLYPHHCLVGKTWDLKINLDGKIDTVLTRTIISMKDNIEVIAGKFENCIHIRQTADNSPDITDFWFRKDVGIIKITTSNNDSMELYNKNF